MILYLGYVDIIIYYYIYYVDILLLANKEFSNGLSSFPSYTTHHHLVLALPITEGRAWFDLCKEEPGSVQEL